MTNSPETRTLNQCTYVPIRLEAETPEANVSERGVKEDFSPKKPFLKQGLLTLVFDDPEVSDLIIKQMRKERKLLRGTPFALLSEALQLLFQKETERAFEILGSVSDDDLVNFVNDGLSKLSKLIKEAETRTNSVISHLADLIKQGQEKDNPSKKEDETKTEGAGNKTKLHSASALATVEESNTSGVPDVSGQIDAPDYSIPLPETVSTVLNVSIAKTLSRVKIQEELQIQAPEVANFLGATGFFSIPLPIPSYATNEVTHLLSFIKVQQDNLLFKKQAVIAIQKDFKVQPTGFLHLEKLQFTPVGYERGELVYSLPLLPGETVRLSHREWSRTEKEFTKIVADSLEKATEEALNEKSELSNSIKSEEKHDSAFKASASTSGGFGPIKFSAGVERSVNDTNGKAAEFSSKSSHELTSKASSRVKHEQKISFRISSQYEIEEQSYREITNKSDNAIRWDFHRMMKKWKIDLYRFGIRLTYDVMIPEPGNYLLRKYIEIDIIEKELRKPNPFIDEVKFVDRSNYEEFGKKYGVAITPPPKEVNSYTKRHEITNSEPKSQLGKLDFIEIILPEGYEIDVPMPKNTEGEPPEDFPLNIEPKGALVKKTDGTEIEFWELFKSIGWIRNLVHENYSKLKKEESNKANDSKSSMFYWSYKYIFFNEAPIGAKMVIQITLKTKLTKQAFKKWQTEAYQLLSEAANAQYQEKQIKLAERRDKLIEELQREDSLSLRKLEREEIMKGVLRWMLGPDFTFYPKTTLPDLELKSDGSLGYFDESDNRIKKQYYEPVLTYSEHVKFLHQAIEWENVNYVLYPYFWTDKNRWDFKQAFFHSDFEHRNFLKAGSARVVLTIRPDFEKDFLSYMESGILGKTLDTPNHPYHKIADEIKAMAETNYKYTPSPQGKEQFGAKLIDTWYEYTPTGALDVTKGTIIEDSTSETGNS